MVWCHNLLLSGHAKASTWILNYCICLLGFLIHELAIFFYFLVKVSFTIHLKIFLALNNKS